MSISKEPRKTSLKEEDEKAFQKDAPPKDDEDEEEAETDAPEDDGEVLGEASLFDDEEEMPTTEEEAEEAEAAPADGGTVPDWYYDGVISEDEMNETTAEPTASPAVRPSRAKRRKSRPWKSGSKRKSTVMKSTVVVVTENPCGAGNLPDALFKMAHCSPDLPIMPKIDLKLGSGVPGLWQPDEDPNEKWICRPEAMRLIKNPRKNDLKLLKILEQKCTEAMELLLEKLEKGFIRNSWERECNPKFQFGVDITPTPSTCGVDQSQLSFASTLTDIDKDRVLYKTPENLVDEINKYLNDAEMAEQGQYTIGDRTYCPNLDLIIDEYLHEPTAEYLLKSVGALDDRGNLLCSYTDFYQVEHAVKSLMVDMAKKCIDKYMAARVPDSGPKERPSQIFNKGYQGRMDMREMMAQVLKEEMEECCPDFSNRRKEEEDARRLSQPTKIYRGTVPMIVPTRGFNSMTREKMAEEIAGRILTGINRRSLFEAGDGEDVIEIMPFQDRYSFVTDSGKPDIIAGPKKASCPPEGGLMLEYPIKAEFKSWTINRKSNICFTPNDYIKPRNFSEWENLKKLNDFTQLISTGTPLSHNDHRLMLQIKYYRHWLTVVRKRSAIRSYSTHDDNIEPYTPKWKGPYPGHVMANVKALKGMSGFQPKSRKSFYKGVRRMEAKMFEECRLLLQNMGKEEEEEPIAKKLGSGFDHKIETDTDFEAEEDESEEEEQDEGSNPSDDDDGQFDKIFGTRLSPTGSTAGSKERIPGMFDPMNDEDGLPRRSSYKGEEYGEGGRENEIDYGVEYEVGGEDYGEMGDDEGDAGEMEEDEEDDGEEEEEGDETYKGDENEGDADPGVTPSNESLNTLKPVPSKVASVSDD